MSKERVTISPPWLGFFRELEALFGKDPEITLRYVDEPTAVKFYVDNEAKAAALDAILPKSKNFGGKVIYVDLVLTNKAKNPSVASLFKTAFEGNPAFIEMIDIEGVFVNPIHYCVFAKEVVQYWNDNLSDPLGNVTTLYQDIAKDIFEESDTGGVIFCTNEY